MNSIKGSNRSEQGEMDSSYGFGSSVRKNFYVGQIVYKTCTSKVYSLSGVRRRISVLRHTRAHNLPI
jgi:hypothetical protein